MLVFICKFIYKIRRQCPAPSRLIILGLFAFGVFTLIKNFNPLIFCVRCLTAIADFVILDAAVVAGTCEGCVRDLCSGFLLIVFLMLNASIRLMLRIVAFVLLMVMLLLTIDVGIVLIWYVFLLSTRQLSLELFID
jgi:hypothetical protein